MPDNVGITPGSGATIATDDIGGVQYQRVKVALGADGEASDLAPGQATMAASVPVAIASNQSAVPVSGPLTDAQLRAAPVPVTVGNFPATQAISASALPLPAGAATEASLATVATNTGRIPAQVAGRLPVDGSGVTQPVSGSVGITGSVTVTGPLTDTQLRASAVPVSATALPLPTGAATETTLGVVATNTGRIPAPVSGRIPVDGSGVTQPISGTVGVSGSVSVTGPLTDVELRASAIPMSASALPLPTGAATEATLAAIAADVDRLPILVSGRMPVDGSGVTQPVSGSVSISGGVAVNNFPTQSAQTFTQAGVIAVNTDLLVIDCNGLAAVSIQCISMGTAGVVTSAFSNDGTNYVAVSILTQAGAVAATFNAAGFWTTPVLGRFLRLRLTTATTGGTTTLAVQGIPVAASIPLVSQPVNVTNTVPVSGSLTSAGTTTNTPVTPTTTLTNSAATTNAANLKGSAGTVWSVVAYNAAASPRYVKLYNLATAPTVGTSVPAMVLAVPATSTVQFDGGTNGIRFSTGIGIGIVTGAADTDTTAPGANEVKVATSWT